jgi:hypothetical protein
MRVGRTLTVTAGAMILVSATAVAASAAASSTFTVGTSGATWNGSYVYDVAVPGTTSGQLGISYGGTLNNWGTDAPHVAYARAQVEGYDYTTLTSAAANATADVSSVIWDPAALYVRYSKAEVCRDRTILPWTCTETTNDY